MAQKIVVESGSVYGRLTILEETEPLVYRRSGTFTATYEKKRYVCRCECGKNVIVRFDQMRSGKTRSCGCLRNEQSRDRLAAGTVQKGNRNRQTHNRTNTTEFWAWHTMKLRCYNPKARSYPHYGGRGIIVCARWLHSFENFLLDMGEKPSPKHSIDRINNDGNYEPGNCKWSTMREQQINRRSNVFLTYQGETLCVADWAARLKLNRGAIQKRLQSGWSVEAALTTPWTPRSLRGKHKRS